MRITREMIDTVLTAHKEGTCEDAYKALAAIALGKPENEVTLEERCEAKDQAFLTLYDNTITPDEGRKGLTVLTREEIDCLTLEFDLSKIEARLFSHFHQKEK